MKHTIAFILACLSISFTQAQGFLSKDEIYKAYNYSIETINEANPDSVFRIGVYDASRVTIDYKKYTNLHKVTYFACSELDLETELLKLKENSNLVSIEVYSNKAKSFPISLLGLPNLKHILLSGMTIDSIPAEINKLDKLEDLLLGDPFSGGVELKYMPETVLDLKNLKRVYLWGNMDFVLPEWFYGLPLKDLELTFLNGFDFNKLCTMNSLTSLTLEGTKLTNLTGISGLKNLKNLYFAQSNDLLSLGQDFVNLSTLEKLELKFVKSMNVTNELRVLASLPKLKSIQLDVEEGIVSLSNSSVNGFASLLELEITALGGNQTLDMAKTLNAFSMAKSLEKLELSRFKETQLPLELYQFANLKTLKISSCDITSISQEIKLLTKLEELKLWFVPITSLPKALLFLPNLSGIYLGSTKVAENDKVLKKLYKNGVKKIGWVN